MAAMELGIARAAVVSYGPLVRRALLLSFGRVADFFTLWSWPESHVDWPGETLKQQKEALMCAMVATMLLSMVFLLTESNRNGCPSFIVALLPLGPCFELITWSCGSPGGAGDLEMPVRDAVRERRNPRGGQQAESITMGHEESFMSDHSFLGRRQQLVAEKAAASNPQLDQQNRLRIMRKLMIAQIPEAIVSLLTCFGMMSFALGELRWTTVLQDTGSPAERIYSSKDVVNDAFKASPHGIIRRYCPDCHDDWRWIFYKRTKEPQDFQPYDYITNHWSYLNNQWRMDFDLYSTYNDAVAGIDARKWKYCGDDEADTKPPAEKPDNAIKGFPGDCAPRDFMRREDQWSIVVDPVAETPSEGQGQDVSFAIERQFTIASMDEVPSLTGAFVRVGAIVMAASTLALGFADIVVFIWIQTVFVRENSHIVVLFYFLDVGSWWPLLLYVGTNYSWGTACRGLLLPGVGSVMLLVLYGFLRPGVLVAKKKGRSRLCLVLGQVLGAALLAPPLLVVNVLFFDRSLTFRPLNTFYYCIRFALVGWTCAYAPVRDAALIISVVSCGLLSVLVWYVVPQKRKELEDRTAAEFASRTRKQEHEDGSAETLSFLSTRNRSPSTAMTFNQRRSILARSSIGSILEQAEIGEQIVQVLNTVSDTFEALLLASTADSPRVRSGILGVAIAPLEKELNAAKQRSASGQSHQTLLGELVPLILPQLLLALRWRTVDDGKDELCPLSHFLLDFALSAEDLPLVAQVYWQLFALSCDKGDNAYQVYRAMRLRLLGSLQCARFAGKTYTEEFCHAALPFLANQRRLYFQMRTVGKAAGRTKGSTQVKTAVLRSSLQNPQNSRRWHGRSCVKRDRDRDTVERATSSSDVTPSFRSRWLGCFQKDEKPDEDVVKEESEKDWLLEQHEDLELDLWNTQGMALPVDSGRGVAAINANKCFVAHSAVAPVVISCLMCENAQPPEEVPSTPTSRSQMYAFKLGDDLRQDALVLQIFRLMEAAWKEKGLEELTLLPYNVLPVTPKEGIVAFVPQAKKISEVLTDYDSDVQQFIKYNCKDVEKGLDNLCGSAAGYCVATYLLGIGDRHLDNVMITNEGHFFHIDFGFVLGDDPKPCNVPLRMPREIMDAIKSSGRHEQFKDLVGEAFLLLRQTARMWTSLVSLIGHAGGNGVSVLKNNPVNGVHEVRQRLHLELSEEAARAQIIAEVEDSASSMVPVVYDKLHQIGLFWN
eukprot:TRINITY_DN18938_c0_g1_i1.p1 TRINITY_DN18938_c0_g1~~TRINITY_DN18938_c0_g1_i1.p1  ORF type:complete len:1223 (-),score=186.77 TRINITY_DN18938_c0_g1_i1:443-4111(-)